MNQQPNENDILDKKIRTMVKKLEDEKKALSKLLSKLSQAETTPIDEAGLLATAKQKAAKRKK